MGLSVYTEPEHEPITLSEAKLHLRVSGQDEDSLIESLITLARVYVENETNRALMTQTLELTLDDFPAYDGTEKQLQAAQSLTGVNYPRFSTIELPRPVLQSVTHIKYIDQATQLLTTLATSEYSVDSTSERGRIQPAYGKFWPVTLGVMNAVTVRYVAGWEAAANVPRPLKQAMLLLIGTYYEFRESVIATTNIYDLPVPVAVQHLLAQYKSWRAA